MSLKEVFESVQLQLKADAKFHHMTQKELKAFVRGFKLCKDEACRICHPRIPDFHDPVDYDYPG